MKKKTSSRIVIGVICFVIFIIVLILSLSGNNRSNLDNQLKQSKIIIDSLLQVINQNYQDKLLLASRIDSCDQKNVILTALNDSLKQAYLILSAECSTNITALTELQRNTIDSCAIKQMVCDSMLQSLAEALNHNEMQKNELERKLTLVQADHSLAVLFMLQCSLSFYDFQDIHKKKVFTYLIETSNLIDSTQSLEALKKLIYDSPRSNFKGVKWAQQKASCP
ncbi:MAG: hypothetical protein JW795_07090, partial [Chitinivibrionales bacterium]|nr:hypothetical protein [Chitinivibrionales bacterium]